jgi:hypothetical protein
LPLEGFIVDPHDIYLKLIEFDQGVRNHLIEWAGGSKQLALLIALELGIKVSTKDAAQVLGLSQSGSRKRINKIKGKRSPKIAPKSVQNAPKVSLKRPSRKRPK